jgi:hypothetical protein
MPGRAACQAGGLTAGGLTTIGLPLRGSVVISKTVVKLLRMFARRIRVEYEQNGRRVPCPMKWLDSFSMRNFTNASAFDNTLPVADGVMEIGTHVPVKELKAAMEDWFRRKSYLAKDGTLVLSESKDPPA